MRTTIVKKRKNKIRIAFVITFAVGVFVGRFAPKWLSETAWATVTEMITGAMERTQTVSKTYLTAFSAAFAAELVILLISLSFVAIPLLMLFFFCGGIGVGTAMTAYFTVFKGHGLLFGVFVLGPQMVGLFAVYILLSELALNASKKLFIREKSENSFDFGKNTGYNISVKIFTFTAFLAIFSLYFALMKQHFAPILPY